MHQADRTVGVAYVVPFAVQARRVKYLSAHRAYPSYLVHGGLVSQIRDADAKR